MSRILSWCRWWRTNAASLPVMRPADHAVDPPAGFRRALAELRTLVPRSEIELLEAPAPQRLAPYAIALTADVIVDDEDRGTGRLVLLHDPDGQDAWEGAWRVVVFAKATLEPEMAGDEMLSDVGWAFLNEALADSGAHADRVRRHRHHDPQPALRRDGQPGTVRRAGTARIVDPDRRRDRAPRRRMAGLARPDGRPGADPAGCLATASLNVTGDR